MAKRIQDQKEEERVVFQVATSSDESIFFHCDKFLHRIESDCIQKSGDADSFGETRQQDEFKFIRRSADFTSATKGCIPWRLNGKASGRPVASRKRRFRRFRQSCGWNLVLQGTQVTGEPVTQNNKAWRQHLAHGASSSVDKESQKDTEATWRHYFQISPHTSITWKPSSPWSGKSLENHLAIQWKI